MIIVKRPKKAEMISIRLTADEKKMLMALANESGETLSSFIRVMIDEQLKQM